MSNYDDDDGSKSALSARGEIIASCIFTVAVAVVGGVIGWFMRGWL